MSETVQKAKAAEPQLARPTAVRFFAEEQLLAMEIATEEKTCHELKCWMGSKSLEFAALSGNAQDSWLRRFIKRWQLDKKTVKQSVQPFKRSDAQLRDLCAVAWQEYDTCVDAFLASGYARENIVTWSYDETAISRVYSGGSVVKAKHEQLKRPRRQTQALEAVTLGIFCSDTRGCVCSPVLLMPSSDTYYWPAKIDRPQILAAARSTFPDILAIDGNNKTGSRKMDGVTFQKVLRHFKRSMERLDGDLAHILVYDNDTSHGSMCLEEREDFVRGRAPTLTQELPPELSKLIQYADCCFCFG